jgi:thymidine kinase
MLLSASPGVIDNVAQVTSRSGLPPHRAVAVSPQTVLKTVTEVEGVRCSHLLIDEAQFLSPAQVGELREFVEADASHRVDCYGLKTDFKGEFFYGSLELMRCADELIEVPSMCSRCRRPATHNMRLDEEGNAIKSGIQVALKETTTYVAVCYHCWYTALNS